MKEHLCRCCQREDIWGRPIFRVCHSCYRLCVTDDDEWGRLLVDVLPESEWQNRCKVLAATTTYGGPT